MEINNLSQYLAQIQAQQEVTQRKTEETERQNSSSQESVAMDTYIPTQILDIDMPMPSATYDQTGSMKEGQTFTASSTSTTVADSAQSSTSVSDTMDSILSQISQTMRVNEDTITSTLDELGLTTADLLNADNMALLTNALNEGAAERGLPTVEDLDSATASLTTFADSAVDSLKSNLSIDDDELDELLAVYLEKLANLAEEAAEVTASETGAEEVASEAATTTQEA